MRDDRNDPFDGLPPTLRQVAEVAGIEAAARLARDHGGTEIYIRRTLDMEHVLVKSVGMEAAASILERFGPGALEVPLWLSGRGQQMARRIMEMLEAGHSEAKIARALQCHIRTVRRYRTRVRDAQMDLFSMLDGEEKSCAGDDFDES